MMMCGAVGGMRIGRGNQSTRRKTAPVPLCRPQIPHYLTWSRTRAAAVESRGLTARAVTLVRFSPSTSDSPAYLYSTKSSIIVITRGRYNRPIRGRPAEWAQFGLQPPTMRIRKIIARAVARPKANEVTGIWGKLIFS
jgi:hypothetical protein